MADLGLVQSGTLANPAFPISAIAVSFMVKTTITNQSLAPPFSPRQCVADNSHPTVVNSIPSLSFCFYHDNCFGIHRLPEFPNSPNKLCVWAESRICHNVGHPEIMFLCTVLFKLGPINLSFNELFSAETADTWGYICAFIGIALKYDHFPGIDSKQNNLAALSMVLWDQLSCLWSSQGFKKNPSNPSDKLG